MTPISAANPGVVSVLEQSIIPPGTSKAVIDVKNALFIYIS